jgi:hypothetical protein
MPALDCVGEEEKEEWIWDLCGTLVPEGLDDR